MRSNAIHTLAQLSRSDLRAIPDGGRQLSSSPHWFVAAGMLHIETAFGLARADRPDDFALHADLAAGMLALADQLQTSATDAGGFERRGALGLGLGLLAEGNIGYARLYLTRVIKRFPDDARLLVALGTLVETVADQPLGRPIGTVLALGQARTTRRADLDEAGRLFTRALSADPALVEADVRLAHLDVLRHDDAAAAARLERVLLLGDIRERTGRTQTAAALYQDAIRDSPDAQSGYIALAHLLHRIGDRRGAARVVEQLRSRQLTPSSGDPWWEYPFGSAREADAILSALQEEGTK